MNSPRRSRKRFSRISTRLDQARNVYPAATESAFIEAMIRDDREVDRARARYQAEDKSFYYRIKRFPN
jgi:hypothetical protein